MKVDCSRLFLVVALLSGAWLGCTNPSTVGDGRPPCDSDVDCPQTLPYCDGEVLYCFQCLDASHCGGGEGRCDKGSCVCESDDNCADDEGCQEGVCVLRDSE